MKILESYLTSLNNSELSNKLSKYNVISYKTNDDIRTGLLRFKEAPNGKCFLFILPNEQIANFHTNGMKFNIDILFYDSNGILDSSFLNIKPGISSIKSKGKVKYVVEIPR